MAQISAGQEPETLSNKSGANTEGFCFCSSVRPKNSTATGQGSAWPLMSTKKRKKGAPKDATRAAKVLAVARFDGQRLKLQDEGIYCAACGKYVGFVEVKHVLEPASDATCGRAGAKTEEERRS
jgi:hypothetical protein